MDFIISLNAICNLLVCLSWIAVVLNVLNVFLCIYNIIKSKKIEEEISVEYSDHSYEINDEQLDIINGNHITESKLDPG